MTDSKGQVEQDSRKAQWRGGARIEVVEQERQNRAA
jgi:hypothetical protein